MHFEFRSDASESIPFDLRRNYHSKYQEGPPWQEQNEKQWNQIKRSIN